MRLARANGCQLRGGIRRSRTKAGDGGSRVVQAAQADAATERTAWGTSRAAAPLVALTRQPRLMCSEGSDKRLWEEAHISTLPPKAGAYCVLGCSRLSYNVTQVTQQGWGSEIRLCHFYRTREGDVAFSLCCRDEPSPPRPRAAVGAVQTASDAPVHCRAGVVHALRPVKAIFHHRGLVSYVIFALCVRRLAYAASAAHSLCTLCPTHVPLVCHVWRSCRGGRGV